MIVTKLFKKEPMVIAYKDVKKVEVKNCMSKKITLHIDENLYQRLELIFEDDEQGLKNFIINRSLDEKSS